MTVFHPTDAAELEQIVAWAAEEAQGLEIMAGGSKRALGRPTQTDHALDMSAFSGIVDYDPAELVLTASAATPMREVQALLDAHGQMLAFEPPDWRHLLAEPPLPEPLLPEPGAAAREPTLGGAVACNLSGPRRIRAGAARDHLLGLAAVNGWGDGWKTGGTMVKNVTGYDLCKLQAGAYGTLSVLTELTVRALPRPESSSSLVLAGLDDEAGVRTLLAALNTPHEVSAAAHLPAAAAARTAAARAGATTGPGPITVLRLEGPRPSVEYRLGALEALLGRGIRLQAAQSVALWAEVAAVQPLLGRSDSIVWRICSTPSTAPAVLGLLKARFMEAEGFYDWGGGLLWVSLDPDQAGADCAAGFVREAVGRGGGQAMLLRATQAARDRVAVFEPAPPPLEALSRRVKASFDPKAVLNPGRMQRGA